MIAKNKNNKVQKEKEYNVKKLKRKQMEKVLKWNDIKFIIKYLIIKYKLLDDFFINI